MGVQYGRSRVADLALRVYDRAVHPEWFSCRGHRRVARTGWEADARLVEGGHVVSWAWGTLRLSEVLGPADLALPEPGLLSRTSLRRERTLRHAPFGRVEYQCCAEAERLDPEVFAHLARELELDATPGRLFHRFASTSRLAPGPIGVLRFEARRRGLSVQSFHTFPEERAIVRVQSLFEVVG